MEDSFCDCHRKPELYVLIKVMSLKETSLGTIHLRCQHVSGGEYIGNKNPFHKHFAGMPMVGVKNYENLPTSYMNGPLQK